MTEPAVDPVLLTARPECTADDACAIGGVFGVRAASARDLGSERDRTFLLLDGRGDGVGVLKVSNAAESAETLDMEAAAVRHARVVDPELPLATPWPGPDGTCRLRWRDHWARLYDVIPGHARHDPMTLDEQALVRWGTTTARLGRALRGFVHPRAIRTMPWDVQHAARCRPMVPAIADTEIRSLVAEVLDRFDAVVAPRWPSLRAQVVHGDLTIDNALVDEHGSIVGIVDFGDMSHTALLVDLASVLDSLGTGRTGGELLRVARLVVDGYEAVTPLEPDELDLLHDVWATRAAVGIAIGSWRAASGFENAAFAERFHDSAAEMIDTLRSRRSSRSHPSVATTDELIGRRARVFGPAVESLSYREPLHVASAAGTWLVGVDGRRYLDLYNNVPCVGHCHPRVTEAIARQARRLNTNLRYLHRSAVELAERLVATMPPGLDTVFFVNSGSEANDLAWRLATGFTGNAGGLCTVNAYHGVSHAIAPFSPEVLDPADRPAHVERWTPTDTYRGTHGDESSFVEALDRLGRRGVSPAMAILDGVLQSDGVHDLAPPYVRRLVELTHDAGGLWVADEVQGGHGRTGVMWSFERFGVEPDVVTMGKPMGNGHPVAAVVTRRDIAERMAEHTVFFSTFGGNQVSVAAAHAVLDVIDDERVLARVAEAGEALRDAVRRICDPVDFVGDVRGMGLANAVEIVTDRDSQRADPERAAALRESLRRHGVLVGTTGAVGNVLKVRPPLSFTAGDVSIVEAALRAALDDIHPR